MKKIVLGVCLVLFLSSCKDKTKIPKNFDYGKIEKGVYSNEFFGFDLPFNEDWSVQTKEEMEEMNKDGREILHGGNERLKKNLEASQVNVADLFSMFEFPMGMVSGVNASLIMKAENLESFPQVKTSKDYLTAARALLDQTSLILSYPKGIYPKRIGGEEFMAMEVHNQDHNITQEYFIILSKGFAISIVISYDNAEQKVELHEMINNLKFN